MLRTLIGHGSVRRRAMGGSFDRPPTAAEMAKMKAMVRQAMLDGAVGMSTGLIYQPGTFAKTDELVEVAKVAAQYDGIYTSHMRHEDGRIFESLKEVCRIAREAGMRAEVSHIKLSGPANWGQADKVMKFINGARAQGLQITEDQYSYLASSTGIDQLIPARALEGGKFNERIADPKLKKSYVPRNENRFAHAQVAGFQLRGHCFVFA